MVAVLGIEPVKRTAKPGSRPCGPSTAFSIHLKLRNIVASKSDAGLVAEADFRLAETQYPDDESMRVSHETIYRSPFIQARGALKKELLDHLRSKRRYAGRNTRIFKDGRGQIPEALSIRERPAEVEDRAIPGHWEGDLLRGSGTVTSPLWWNAVRALSC